MKRSQIIATTSTLALAAALAAIGPVAADEPVPASTNPAATVADIVRDPTDLPPPITYREPRTVQVELETIELVGQLDDGTTYRYWTFNGQVPGPMLRVRVGDTVEVSFRNRADSWMPHNVDFHAVTGPHGGGGATFAEPGQHGQGFTFKALNPGLYVYHCAVPSVAHHISNGMYGMILVEPEEGLTPVDREFYVMQGEIYTEQPFGTEGELSESYEKMSAEQPEYYVFNGAVGGLTEQKPLEAEVGETVRVFFGVGGPNATSSFHVIGEIFDTAYPLASLTGAPLTDVQTLTVPPGGAAIVEMELEVPGTYVLVDHALSRAERGLVGHLVVTGPDNPDVFQANGGHQEPAS
jgi:nitrite reductase (NO-forming)